MISWRHCTKYVRYVSYEQAQDYCRLGWALADAFEPWSWHAQYCVLAAWLCQCKPVEPPREQKR
jgi:hypothetical protein